VFTNALGSGCGPCGVSTLILSVIATAASTQLNTMILSIVIAPAPSGPDRASWPQDCLMKAAVHSDRGHRPTPEIELAYVLPR